MDTGTGTEKSGKTVVITGWAMFWAAIAITDLAIIVGNTIVQCKTAKAEAAAKAMTATTGAISKDETSEEK